MPPNFATVFSTHVAIWASSPKSVWTNRLSSGLSWAMLSPSFSLISAITTLVPSRRNARTTAAPIFVAPPVTIATLPLKPSIPIPRLFLALSAGRLSRGSPANKCATHLNLPLRPRENRDWRGFDTSSIVFLRREQNGATKGGSMRKIAIIGGGQSGLQLALGLQQNNYDVTVVSNRTPEQVFNGRVTSSQFMFHDSLQNERDLGINFWEKDCPNTDGIAFTIPGPNKSRALFWEAKLDHYGQSVDQRVKFAGWMKEFAKRGGNLVIQDAGPQEVDAYSK